MTKITPKPSAAKTQAAKKASQSAGRQVSVGNCWVGAQVPKEKEERREVEELVWAMVGWGLWSFKRVVCGARRWRRWLEPMAWREPSKGRKTFKML